MFQVNPLTNLSGYWLSNIIHFSGKAYIGILALITCNIQDVVSVKLGFLAVFKGVINVCYLCSKREQLITIPLSSRPVTPQSSLDEKFSSTLLAKLSIFDDWRFANRVVPFSRISELEVSGSRRYMETSNPWKPTTGPQPNVYK